MSFYFIFLFTATDNERVLSDTKSSSAVSEPPGACPPTSGCLMADRMKEGCLELEGGSEAGNSLCVVCAECVQNWKKICCKYFMCGEFIWGEYLLYVCYICLLTDAFFFLGEG